MNSAPDRLPWMIASIAVALMASAGAGPYDTLPLRSNLSPLPYFATEGGRENKRFAGAEINRYHLYDFYRRQAAYEFANPSNDATTLPPCPGLDGGRRGHWGVTNEKETVAYDRNVLGGIVQRSSSSDAFATVRYTSGAALNGAGETSCKALNNCNGSITHGCEKNSWQ